MLEHSSVVLKCCSSLINLPAGDRALCFSQVPALPLCLLPIWEIPHNMMSPMEKQTVVMDLKAFSWVSEKKKEDLPK